MALNKVFVVFENFVSDGRQNSNIKLSRRSVFLPFLSTATSILLLDRRFAAAEKLKIEQVKDIIQEDIVARQYYVTGNLTKDIYSDNCKFVDPTTNVTGVDVYTAAIKTLFDPNESKHELLSIRVATPNTIEAEWRLEGYLKFPWRPHIAPYEGTTVYTLGTNGLVSSHEETWKISVLQAFLEFLTPSFN